MLASHNTLTYLPPRHWWARLIAPWWRCQSKAIEEQVAAGATHLDIRVRRHHGRWRPCHGRIDLGKEDYYSLTRLVNALIPQGVTARLVLERGCQLDRQIFAAVATHLNPDIITEAAVKHPWTTLRTDSRHTADHYFKPLDTARPWWRQIPGLLRALILTPRLYARRHPIAPYHPTDPILHFHDFL